MDTHTFTNQPQAAPVAVTLKPAWLRVADAVKLYGIGRSSLYKLIEAGEIKTAVVRNRGTVRGIRLLSADSLSAYLETLAARA